MFENPARHCSFESDWFCRHLRADNIWRHQHIYFLVQLCFRFFVPYTLEYLQKFWNQFFLLHVFLKKFIEIKIKFGNKSLHPQKIDIHKHESLVVFLRQGYTFLWTTSPTFASWSKMTSCSLARSESEVNINDISPRSHVRSLKSTSVVSSLKLEPPL